jgi:carbamoyltransferase
MKVLGLNYSHDASACIVEDGKIQFYQEEALLSRKKKTRFINDLFKEFKNQKFDTIVWGREYTVEENIKKDQINEIIENCKTHNISYKDIKWYNEHHLYHAASSFFNSKFKKAYCLVMDGRGVNYIEDGEDLGREITSLYYFNGKEFELKFKIIIGHKKSKNKKIIVLNTESIGYLFVILKEKFKMKEEGSVMGLASYGECLFFKENNTKFYKFDGEHFILNADFLFQTRTFLDIPACFILQNDLEIMVKYYINKIIEEDPNANICCSGGIFQNCQLNYKLLDISKNIFIDPISHDGGTSMGMALLESFKNKENIKPYSNLYLGIEPEYNLNLNLNNFRKVTYIDIAKLISEGNIIAMFQGKPEAGPRALGNRSFLFDPRDIHAKEKVNLIKNREWYRPYAGTILHEYCHEWFDLKSKEETPYMSYAVKAKENKISKIPGIIHVDKTCRIQTLKKEQNVHFYNLINSFYELTDVPILLNTSFNVAGEPLVNSLKDAFNCVHQNNFRLIYFPEINILFRK